MEPPSRSPPTPTPAAVTSISGATSPRGNFLAGGPFDFLSVCPPYKLVDYPSLLESIATSPLVTPSTHVIVEYASEDAELIVEELGELVKLKERRYGRTFLVIYGPP